MRFPFFFFVDSIHTDCNDFSFHNKPRNRMSFILSEDFTRLSINVFSSD